MTDRELFVYRYRSMYQIQPGRVEVRAFVHGSRDFAALRRHQDSE